MIAPLVIAAALGAAPAGDANSEYEQTLIRWGMAQHGAALEPAPEGKVIDDVLTAREDVFSASDPVPTWLNVFHGRTRENVVLREVLLKKGERWTKAKADETERNLRALIILAVAKVVAVQSPKGGVIALVVTKDRWSFRANWDYVLVGSVLERLHVPITETNFLGRGIEVTLDPFLRRDTFQIGEEVVWRRFLDSRVLLAQSIALVFNRVSGKLEGSAGVVQVARPLITLDQRWGFSAFAVWNVRRTRLFRGRAVWELGHPNDESAAMAPGAPSCASSETVPCTVSYVFDRKDLDAAALGYLQLGGLWKHRITAGLGGYVHQYTPPPETPLQPFVDIWFRATKLPRSEDATYLYAAWQFFRAQFVQRHDMETYGLTEDYQVGPRVVLAAQWAVPTLAKNHFVAVGASARWRFFFGDDMLLVQAASAARWQVGGQIVNQHYAFEIANWSPPLEGGRFVTRIFGEFRNRDLNNNQIVLGAGGGLRGVPSGALTGRNMLLGNFEYRARPFNITTLLAGLVLFYDVGTTFDESGVVHTIGAGLRILVPQLNTVVIRLDLGFIIGSPNSQLDIDRFSSTFGQVTQLRERPDFFDDPL